MGLDKNLIYVFPVQEYFKFDMTVLFLPAPLDGRGRLKLKDKCSVLFLDLCSVDFAKGVPTNNNR